MSSYWEIARSSFWEGQESAADEEVEDNEGEDIKGLCENCVGSVSSGYKPEIHILEGLAAIMGKADAVIYECLNRTFNKRGTTLSFSWGKPQSHRSQRQGHRAMSDNGHLLSLSLH